MKKGAATKTSRKTCWASEMILEQLKEVKNPPTTVSAQIYSTWGLQQFALGSAWGLQCQPEPLSLRSEQEDDPSTKEIIEIKCN